jgi:DinB superfamily
MTELLDYLDVQRAELRAAFDAIPAAARDRSPGPGLWSTAAIVEHLAMVGERIAQRLAKGIDEARASGIGPETSTDPILPTLNLERALDRSKRFTAPDFLKPTGLDGDAAWAALERATVHVRAAVAAGDGLALEKAGWPHPVFGQLSLYEWIGFVGAHEARHAAQMREMAGV